MGRLVHRNPEYLMAALVLVLVVVVSIARTGGFAITVGAEAEAPVPAAAEDFPWYDDGMTVWVARCYGCHADLTYIPDLFLADGGREYLLEMLLFGVRGEVVIEGVSQNLRHRPYDSLSDDELSAVLNLMLVAWDNAEQLPPDTVFYTPEEVAAGRTPERSNEEVLERRPNPWQ